MAIQASGGVCHRPRHAAYSFGSRMYVRSVRAHPGQSQLGSVPFFRQTPRFTGRISRLSEKEANSMPVIFFLIDAFSRMLKLSRTGRFI